MTRYQTYQMPYGFATSSAVWQIQKIDETTGMVITWGGTGAFDNIWNNRASLSYS